MCDVYLTLDYAPSWLTELELERPDIKTMNRSPLFIGMEAVCKCPRPLVDGHEVFIRFAQCDYLLAFDSPLKDLTPNLVKDSLSLQVTHVVK